MGIIAGDSGLHTDGCVDKDGIGLLKVVGEGIGGQGRVVAVNPLIGNGALTVI